MQGKDGMVLNPDFENFRTSTWPEFRQWIPWSMVVPQQRYRQNPAWEPQKPFSLVFTNGAKVICKGLRDPEGARGPNVNWFWYDEGGRDESGMGWTLANGGVRIGEETQSFVTTTPKGRNHWLYKFFVEKDIPEDALKLFRETIVGRELVEMFFCTIEDNKDNLDPAFYASMLAAYPPGWLRDQELGGKFVLGSGTLGDSAWFKDKIVMVLPESIHKRVRYWDLAASEKKVTGKKKIDDPDYTVGTRMSCDVDDNDYIEDMIYGQWKWSDIKQLILDTAMSDGPYVMIYVEQEPGAGGKNQVAELADFIHEKLGEDYKILPHRPNDVGDKIVRANFWFAKASRGAIYLLHGIWNHHFLDRLGKFPAPPGGHDDEVDSVSGGYAVLHSIRKWRSGIEFIHI